MVQIFKKKQTSNPSNEPRFIYQIWIEKFEILNQWRPNIKTWLDIISHFAIVCKPQPDESYSWVDLILH